MGLDMYAHAGDKEFYWRKHNRLHGWMEELWESKGKPFNGKLEDNPLGDFNCVELELTLEDIDQLEEEIVNMTMPETAGFFFGGDSFEYKDDDGNEFSEGDYFHKKDDLKFIEDARKALAKGERVTYYAWY